MNVVLMEYDYTIDMIKDYRRVESLFMIFTLISHLLQQNINETNISVETNEFEFNRRWVCLGTIVIV